MQPCKFALKVWNAQQAGAIGVGLRSVCLRKAFFHVRSIAARHRPSSIIVCSDLKSRYRHHSTCMRER